MICVHRQTDRHTDRHTDRQQNPHTDKHEHSIVGVFISVKIDPPDYQNQDIFFLALIRHSYTQTVNNVTRE